MSDVAGAFQMALTTLTGAISVVKYLREVDKRLDDAELRSKLAEVYNGLSDTKMHVADLKVALIEKDQTIRALREQLAIRKTVVRERSAYWTVDGDKKDGPLCPQCWDNDEKRIHMRLINQQYDGWRCPTCRNYFTLT